MFMNPDSMELKTTMFLPNSTIATGQLCPDQRRMPQIVSVPFGFIFFCFDALTPLLPPGFALCGDGGDGIPGHEATHRNRGLCAGHA